MASYTICSTSGSTGGSPITFFPPRPGARLKDPSTSWLSDSRSGHWSGQRSEFTRCARMLAIIIFDWLRVRYDLRHLLFFLTIGDYERYGAQLSSSYSSSMARDSTPATTLMSTAEMTWLIIQVGVVAAHKPRFIYCAASVEIARGHARLYSR